MTNGPSNARQGKGGGRRKRGESVGEIASQRHLPRGMRKKVREVRNVIIMEIVALPLLLPEPKMRDR